MNRDELPVGEWMHALARALYPVCRSITGDGLRQSLRLLQEHIPLQIQEVPSGTEVFDWTVPKEWNIRDAWIKNPRGEKVVDFQQLNLHVVNYSVPVRRRMSLAELKPYLFSLPDRPDWVPYRTSYYKESWGFCLRHRDLEALPEGEYEVCIDSTLESGHLSYGEWLLPGASADEVLFSCHACHPSLANDNLAGLSVAAALARQLGQQPRRYSYRFLFIPGTIGSITWLARNEQAAARIQHGLVLTCLGDAGPSTYKRSRRGQAEIDRAAVQVLKDAGSPHRIVDFIPYGYDERQYCSPGFNLPVGCLMRTPNGQYPEYHTSADNLDFIRPEFLADSFGKAWAIVEILEQNRVWVNQNPKCEPRLGRRGLYNSVGGQKQTGFDEMALLWVLNLSDGQQDLLSIAERSGLAFRVISQAAAALAQCGLLRPA
jgi:aminopeptidase-like protein